MNRYASLGKRDANEAAIVKALRKAGCTVVSGTDVDLFVSFKYINARGNDETYGLLMEIKVPGKRTALTALQRRLLDIFPEQMVVVTSVEEALAAVGIASGTDTKALAS